MKLKNIKVRVFEKGGLRGFATVTTQEGFVLDGFCIFSGPKGLFVNWPQQLQKDGSYKDLTSTEAKETKYEVADLILEAYKSEKANPTNPAPSASKSFKGGKPSSFPKKDDKKQPESKDDDEELWS